MSPLIEKDATINVNLSQTSYEAKKTENRGSEQSHFLSGFLEKFTKWLSAEELSKWKRKHDFFQLRKIPFFILFISVLEVMVYLAANDKLREVLLYDTDNRREIWRFLTYMLLHTDAIHLALNILIQGLLGTPLELEQGPLRCAAIYFSGGLAGSLGTLAFATFPLMAGASGGVYALLTSQIPNVVLNYGTIRYAGYRIFTVSVLIASDVIYIFCHVYFYNNERPRIGWVAHASGAAAGVLLGFLLFDGTSKCNRKFRLTSCPILASPSVVASGFSLAHSALRP